MRRRRVLNVLTALSLLLCVAVVGLWVRSYFAHDIVHVVRPNRHLAAGSTVGSYVATYTVYVGDIGPSRIWVDSVGVNPEPLRLPVTFNSGRITKPAADTRFIRFPQWTFVALFSLLPAFRLLALFRDRRRRLSAARGFPVDAATPNA